MSAIIFQDEETAKTVMQYLPKKISVGITRAAQNFVIQQPTEEATNFRISPLVAEQTGIHRLEELEIEKRIEQKALEQFKDIQEAAYREAFDLGKEEGRKRGYEEAKEIVGQRMLHLNRLIEKLTRIKLDILQRNEVQIMDFLYMLASKIALFEIEKRDDRILPVLEEAMKTLQRDENMVVRISKVDSEYLEKLKETSGVSLEFITNQKLEPTEGVEPGGCIIETNFGMIDATIEERVEKLWAAINDAKPLVKRDEFK